MEENRLITNDHESVIKDHIKFSEKSIKIISPFISFQSLDFIKNTRAEITIITRFSLEDFAKGSSSIDCLSELLENNNVKIYAMKDLHTKLYIFDDNTAILGSANFTDGGLIKNVELSIELNEKKIVRDLIEYFENSFEIAKKAPITQGLISEYDKHYSLKPTASQQQISYDSFEKIFNIESEEETGKKRISHAIVSEEEYNLVMKNIEILDSVLSLKEQDVINLRLGLKDGRQRTLQEIGDLFGLTKERIRQIMAKAHRKLRHPNRSKLLRNYIDKIS